MRSSSVRKPVTSPEAQPIAAPAPVRASSLSVREQHLYLQRTFGSPGGDIAPAPGWVRLGALVFGGAASWGLTLTVISLACRVVRL